MKLKLIADLNISPLTVKELKDKGYEIIRVTEKLSATASDREIIQLASEEQAVIITQDMDFSAIIAQSRLRRPSIISLRLENVKPDRISKLLISVIPLVEKELAEGVIISIDEKGYRIRKLPVF